MTRRRYVAALTVLAVAGLALAAGCGAALAVVRAMGHERAASDLPAAPSLAADQPRPDTTSLDKHAEREIRLVTCGAYETGPSDEDLRWLHEQGSDTR